MDKVRVVLDSNVLISALGWDGKPKECFNLVLNNEIIPFTSPALLEELSKVMDYRDLLPIPKGIGLPVRSPSERPITGDACTFDVQGSFSRFSTQRCFIPL